MNLEDFDEEELFNELGGEMVTTLVQISANTALELTKIIVDNNHRNNVKMSNQDIYNIHSDSFAAAFASLAQAQQ